MDQTNFVNTAISGSDLTGVPAATHVSYDEILNNVCLSNDVYCTPIVTDPLRSQLYIDTNPWAKFQDADEAISSYDEAMNNALSQNKDKYTITREVLSMLIGRIKELEDLNSQKWVKML